MARKTTKPPSSEVHRAPVDRDRWSESSKHSYIYWSARTHYTDIRYSCRKCGTAATYTAEEQKEAFEVRKANVWQRRVLCTRCFQEAEEAERRVRAYEEAWAENKQQLQNKPAQLSEWLQLLETLPSYGRKRDSAKIAMLRKLISAQQGAPADAAKRRG